MSTAVTLELVSLEELLRLNYRLCGYIQLPNVYVPHVERIGRLITSGAQCTLFRSDQLLLLFHFRSSPHYCEG